MNTIDQKYQNLLFDIMQNGWKKGDRTGTGTVSVFGREIRHSMNEGFPLLTTKKMAWKQIVTELLWFLRGETNIKSLVEQNNYIWVGDAYKAYKTKHNDQKLTQQEFIERIKTDDEFAKEHGELGPIYGKAWRDWDGIDQISNLFKELRFNPDSRRIKVSAWNPSKLPITDYRTDDELYNDYLKNFINE